MTTNVFNSQLLDGEEILWTGQPRQGLILTGRDALLIPFSLLWGGFALFWETLVLSQKHAPAIMKIWGIPFVLAGIYVIVGRFFVDAYVRKRMHYAITNRRIMILRAPPFAAFTSLQLDRLSELTVAERANGQGTITFGQPSRGFGRNGFASLTPALDATPKFIHIDDAQTVYRAVQRAMKPAASIR
jgi:hypothetical protein